MGGPFGSLEPPWGRFGCHFGVPRCYFSRFSSEKCVFAISMPLCSGIATFEGLGAQVGATWVQKSRPNRLLGALATDRGSRPPKKAPKFTPGQPFGLHFQDFLRNSDPCSVETAYGIQIDDQSDPPGTHPHQVFDNLRPIWRCKHTSGPSAS